MRRQPSDRSDPDPVSLGLTILGALGSAAGLADLAARHVRKLRQPKARSLTRLVGALNSAERAALALGGKVDQLAAFVRSAPQSQVAPKVIVSRTRQRRRERS